MIDFTGVSECFPHLLGGEVVRLSFLFIVQISLPASRCTITFGGK